MDEYISREAVVRYLKGFSEKELNGRSNFGMITSSVLDKAERAISEMPAADVQPVKHGRWEVNGDRFYPFCSNCKYKPPKELIRYNALSLEPILTKYCPNVALKTELKYIEAVTKMREILFRAKREENGEWVYGYYVRLPDVTGSVHRIYVPADNPDESNNVFYIDPETVGQFTGLTDKNGAKIFEGDIIKVDDDFDTFGKMAGEIREVWFKDGGFRLKPKYSSTIARGDRGYWIEDGTDFEVIGNVWDNPELLGGGSDD